MKASDTNLGWLFYKDYYRQAGIDWNQLKSGATKSAFERQNRKLFGATYRGELEGSFAKGNPGQELRFRTAYPGLLIGSGYNHETGAEGEIKIGFYFDHSTGLPAIPGSSVKGVLRHACEQGPYLEHILEEYIQPVKGTPATDELIRSIFTGAGRRNMYQHDIFYDAVIIRGNDQGFLLGSDFITPHRHRLKNPIPIQFLKVLPGAELSFRFSLRDDAFLTAEEKVRLFKILLEDMGVGAKTAVGYGRLEFVK